MSASVIQLARDGLYSLIGKLGVVGQDKAASTVYGAPLMTEAELLNAYRGSWLARKIIDIPALDSCRNWRAWQAEEDQIGLIEAEEVRLGVRSKVLEARTKARLFGGAAIYISTGDARPEEEFNPERVGKGGIRFLNVMLPRHVQAGEIETDPESPNFGKPAYYTLTSQTRGQVRIHPSRLVIFTGAPHVDLELSQSQANSWGDSVLISTLQAIKNADATAGNVARMIFEARVDVIKMNGLMERFAEPGYEDRVVRRYELAAMQKDVNGFLLMDTEEEYEQKSTSFAQLPELMDRFVQLCAGAADIPVTRLLGMSPAGMNSTGTHDMKNYHDRISASQELEMKPAMVLMDEALIRSALGGRPKEVWYKWAPLEQMNEKEIVEIGEKSAIIIEKLQQTGLFAQEALAAAATNMMVESGVIPGLEQYVENAPTPDYDMSGENAEKPDDLDGEEGGVTQ